MNFRLSFFFFFVLVFSGSALVAQPSTGDITLDAMRDEMNRNLKELQLPDFERPFFLMYGIVDQKNATVAASLGSVTRSTDSHERYRSATRVLVGDYQFNDESLDDNLTSAPTSNQIDIPIEEDYWGIRRSFWSATDKVYRDAAKNVVRNREALKETNKDLDAVPHRSFAKATPVTIVSPIAPFAFDKKILETRARKLSGLFLGHYSIRNSGVLMNYLEGVRYLVNTEGTVVRSPFRIAAITSMAVVKTPDGEQAFKRIIHVAATPDKLPDDAQLSREIEQMILQLEKESNVPKFADEYSGPVLLIGQPVADVLAMGVATNVLASDNIPKLSGLQYDAEFFGNDGKVGRSIMSEDISVVIKPKLKMFDGEELFGSFDVDNEGIVPADEVSLIDHGILKCLLNNRTITSPSQTANGFGSGPGVVQVNIASKTSEKTLKKKLLEKAKKQGLDYAIIVRADGAGEFRQSDVYKVRVSDGKEELIRGAALGKLETKTLKHISGATEKYQAFSIGAFGQNSSNSGTGLTSIIVPTAVLIDEMDVKRFPQPLLKETDYVKNPLE